MRCPYCGSKMLYPDTQHKHFSTGKAVAGAVTFGVIGAAAGFIGKDTKGYRCSACGAFSESPMPMNTEYGINTAVRDAEAGWDYSVYEQLKRKYPNIEAVAPRAVSAQNIPSIPGASVPGTTTPEATEAETATVKNTYMPLAFVAKSPLYVERVVIKATPKGDVLSLTVWNISTKTVRSAYFTVKVLDDVGDEISTLSCVYQGLSVASGSSLPLDKEFSLKTDIAYKVVIQADKAAFDDDSVWRAEENAPENSLLEQAEILPENFPKYPYLRALLAKKSTLPEDARLFQPIFEENFVQCICGLPMDAGCTCVRCGLDAKKLSEVLSYDVLTEYQHKTVKALAEKRTKAVQKLYKSACQDKYKKALALQQEDTKAALAESEKLFGQIADYEDAKAQIEICKAKEKALNERLEAERIAAEKAAEERRIEEARLAEERRIKEEKERAEREAKEKAKQKKLTIFAIASIAFLIVSIVFSIVYKNIIVPNQKYEEAIALMNEGNYSEAAVAFEEIIENEDAATMRQECLYQQAVIHINEKRWSLANPLLEEIKGYKDSADLLHYHTYKAVDYKEATCTENGYKKYRCACGDNYKLNIASGHEYSKATCTSASKCIRCNKKISEALGHTSDKAICERCGTVLFKTKTYSGRGDKDLSITLPEGKYLFTLSCSGAGEKYWDVGFSCLPWFDGFVYVGAGEKNEKKVNIYSEETEIIKVRLYSDDITWKIIIEAVKD